MKKWTAAALAALLHKIRMTAAEMPNIVSISVM